MTILPARRVQLQTTLCPIEFGRANRDGRTLTDPGRPAIEEAALLRAIAPTAEEARWLAANAESDAGRVLVEASVASNPLVLVAAIAAMENVGDIIETIVAKLATYRGGLLRQKRAELVAMVETIEEAWADAEAQAYSTRVGNERDEQADGALGTPRPSDQTPMFRALFSRMASFETQPFALRVRSVFSSPHVASAQKKALLFKLEMLGLKAASPTLQADWETLGVKEKAFEKLGAGKPESAAAVSPIGYLHCERLSYVPAGIEHGRLLYTLPLAPGERVAVVHQEWSNDEEEFTSIVSDEHESFSERGVVDKNDMASATENQRIHASSFSVAVSASGGLGPMTTTIGSSYSAGDTDISSRKATLTQSQTLTQKASARARKGHWVSVRLAKKSGTADETMRWVHNPDPAHAVRYDYYELLRKWEVQVHRYDVRLTYDLTIPAPAVDLLGVYREIWDLDKELDKGFVFDLAPGTVTRTNWRPLAEQYGATVEPPPPLVLSVQTCRVLGPYPAEDPKGDHIDELRVAVPDGYTYFAHHGTGFVTMKDPNGVQFPAQVIKLHDILSPTPEIVFGVRVMNAADALASVRVVFQLGAEAENKWRLAAFNALQQAARRRHDERRQILEDRRAQLLSELSKMDALTLRKLEREEIMKGVLRWLFGPNLSFAAPILGPFYDADGGVISKGVQGAVLQHGKLISFLHQAIEWENMNYRLYPYFWSERSTWDERMRLEAEDPIHASFLRSGAARVVIPVRRGWERAFLTFLQTGSMYTTLPDQHPYMTIADELEKFAETNYPGIVPANPAEVDADKGTKAAEGILIGAWYEYTPTSGVDVKIGEEKPTEGSFMPPTFEPSATWATLGPVIGAVQDLLVAITKKINGGP